jgi:hypothetical protein
VAVPHWSVERGLPGFGPALASVFRQAGITLVTPGFEEWVVAPTHEDALTTRPFPGEVKAMQRLRLMLAVSGG